MSWIQRILHRKRKGHIDIEYDVLNLPHFVWPCHFGYERCDFETRERCGYLCAPDMWK